MDNTKPTIIKNHPALIVAGKTEQTIRYAHQIIQKGCCQENGCGHCVSCSRVIQHQHPNLLWLDPEGSYTRETLEQLFETIVFKREEQETFFCVLNHADRMNASCYNSLLKTLEEPHPGYHFILLSERAHTLAPTIRSRCVIHQLESDAPSDITNPIAHFFTTIRYEQPEEFARLLEQDVPNEIETISLIDDLLAFWISKQRNAYQTGDQQTVMQSEHALAILEDALKNPPPTGSSLLFWKYLFIRMKN